MNVSLKDINTVFDLMKTIDKYSILLWLSILLPILYISFKKLTLPPDDNKSPNKIQGFFNLPILPKIESRLLWIFMMLFVAGVLYANYGTMQMEKIRKLGLRVKNHYTNQNAYSQPVLSISNNLNADTEDLVQLAENYPAEFTIVPSDNQSKTLLMTDSATLTPIIQNCERLLDSYLSNDSLKGKPLSYKILFDINQAFTIRVIEKLIADSAHKYSYIPVVSVTEPAIVRRITEEK